ncbi:hypothetical protein THRCLA_09676 [Thraustotheca clavata]|uniref:Uncharacterized protein n=1 Tax=Thraustotheca clavata TaxID=74557 RepID=A0A1V9YV31_9STRA|nr:hypothetical protein THRCLA_09676 [Thraustotheca clavata]
MLLMPFLSFKVHVASNAEFHQIITLYFSCNYDLLKDDNIFPLCTFDSFSDLRLSMTISFDNFGLRLMQKQELPSSRQQTQRWYISEDSAGFHWWPLPIAIFAISAVIYAGAFSYDQGWLDEFTGNLTRIQFHDPDVLKGGCMAINHKMTWREMNNKAGKCSRGQYYDALHNDCFACAAPGAQDRIFGLNWDVQADCYNMMTFPDFRYTTHIYWNGASIDPSSGSVTLPKRPDNHTSINRCMVETRMRCIKQIGVIGASKSEFALAFKNEANIATFVSSAMDLITKYRLDGLHIADISGNDNSNNGDWKSNYGPTVVKYLAALRKGLNDLQSPNTPAYTLSWEELASAFDTSSTNSTSYKGCKQISDSSGLYRCFNSDIISSVDWINFQTFSRNPSVSLQSLLNSKTWMTSVPSTKFVFGTCSVSGANMCRGSANGKDELIIVAKAGSDLYKGVSLDSGTADIEANKGSSISAMGPLGAYGVLMPQRAPLQATAPL